MNSKIAFFLLKAANLVLITVYSFSLVYILIRVVGHSAYPLVVATAAIGNYVIATDLGYSGYVYFDVRKHFLQGTLADRRRSIGEALTLYFVLALVAGGVGALVIMVGAQAALPLRAALSLFFISVVLPLPWLLLRKVAAAMDHYLVFEVCELVRRVSFLALSLLMLAGLSFLAFSALCIVAWAVSFGVAFAMLARRGLSFAPSSPGDLVRHVRQNRSSIFRSGSLTVLEFLIYNFPYLAIPAVFRNGTDLIAFDLFYKISRFGALAYSVPAEATLPHQTRAFHQRRWREVWAYSGAIILVGGLVCAAAAVVILGFGDQVFRTLLSKGGIVTGGVRLAMVGMLAAMVLQVAAGSLLVNTGLQGRLAKLTVVTCLFMAGLTLMTLASGLSFEQFLGGYVAAYALHAALYASCFVWFVTRSARRGPAGASGPA